MKRTVVALVFVFIFLVPMTSWSAPPNINEQIALLNAKVAELQGLVASLQSQLTAETTARSAADTTLSSSISVGDSNTLSSAKTYTDAQIPASDSFVTTLKNYMTVDTTNDRIIFSGVNVQVVNGTTDTYFSINGKGNLIIGYDYNKGDYPPVCSFGLYQSEAACTEAGHLWAVNHKSGSHNLIIGDGHNYSSSGGFVAGHMNTINRLMATVTGGAANEASGEYSTVCGGWENKATGWLASISGGRQNTSSGAAANVGAGYGNTAEGGYSSVSGGYNNKTWHNYSTVSGGMNYNSTSEYSLVP